MRIKDLAKLKKEKTPQQIIALHIHNRLFLTNKQINELIKERDEDKSKIILT